MCPSGVRRVTFVLGTSAGGTGAHVRMLAAGLARRGAGVRVAGPARTAGDLGLDAIPGAGFTAVEFGDRPRPADAMAILALRRLLTAPDTRPDVVHAHGMRAGALTALALAGVGTAGDRTPKLAVTVHNAPPPGGGAASLVYLALERVVGRRADLVLAVSADLEQRMREAGARDVARAVVPAPARPAPQESGSRQPVPDDGRPLVLAVGRLAPQKGFATLLEAAMAWQHLTPRPRLLIAGDGPLKAELEAKAKELTVDAEFPGHRSDIPELLASARVFVLPSLWEGQPLVLQEAFRAGVPIVASDTGGIGGLTGDDAALLVGPGDAEQLGETVMSVLENDDLAARLRAAARRRAAALPAEDDAVAAVLAAYSRVCE
ncbi:MAG TPA: glycosyltransferase family 4 protein [Trebonia sp.]